MMTRFHQSWQLFKASIVVTFQHRKLLWFPLLSTLLTGVIALFFLSAMALPLMFHDTGYPISQKQHWVALGKYYFPPESPAPAGRFVRVADAQAPATRNANDAASPDGSSVHGGATLWWCGVPAIYLVSMFLATFFNVVFYNEILEALDGRGVSFRRGWQTARSRLPSILAWSLLAGVVGWGIRFIEQRLPMAGRIIAGLVGIAWSIAAVFAIPVIIRQPATRNPISILQGSAQALKRTWGEGLIGYVGFSAASLALFGSSLLPLLLLGLAAWFLKSLLLAIVALVFWVCLIVVMTYVSSVAQHVYRCALFKYAVEGVVPAPYSRELLDMAWKVKKARVPDQSPNILR
jgi:hypothetical protein